MLLSTEQSSFFVGSNSTTSEKFYFLVISTSKIGEHFLVNNLGKDRHYINGKIMIEKVN